LGIEINPRAAAIAELVIWIGYLQWFFKRYGNAEPPEPVLQAFNNIENRDAVLAYDGTEPYVDAKTGQVRTRWGGSMMQHPVTGEQVPDPSDQVVILKYLNARAAEWPEADYVVSNPPFIGNARMREALGDGYATTIRSTYKDVPETVDYVMYWWHKSAEMIRNQTLIRFGLITTNSICQVLQRKVIEQYLSSKNPIRLIFAIPDHPWVDEGAAVRIAMTVAENDSKLARISKILLIKTERAGETPEESADSVTFNEIQASKIFSNLQSGVDVGSAMPLKSNSGLSCPGMKLHGSGFIVTSEQAECLEREVTHKYLNGRDLLQTTRSVSVVDLFGLTKNEAQQSFPHAYQWVYEHVKPERDQNNRKAYRDNWWIFGEPRANFRPALQSLTKYIATVETAKHRVFVFLDGKIVPDNMLIAIAFDDAYFLGVLSSSFHAHWCLVNGGSMGMYIGNIRYNKRLFRVQGDKPS
jgi:hypothetical protein